MSTQNVFPKFNSEEWHKHEIRRQEIAKDLIAKGTPFLTALVMSGDIISAETATELVKNGMDAEEAIDFIGSYARFDWAVKNLPRPRLLTLLPELWVAADPDDTKPEYLELWHSEPAFFVIGSKL